MSPLTQRTRSAIKLILETDTWHRICIQRSYTVGIVLKMLTLLYSRLSCMCLCSSMFKDASSPCYKMPIAYTNLAENAIFNKVPT